MKTNPIFDKRVAECDPAIKQEVSDNVDKKLNMKKLSPYKVYWAEFTPLSGRVVTGHDQKALGSIWARKNQKVYRMWFGSKEKAIEYLKTFSGKLDKRYAVRLFTDKQFSLAKRETGYAIPFTEKQKKEVYYIG